MFINPDIEQIKPEWYEEQIKPFHYLYRSSEGYKNTGTFVYIIIIIIFSLGWVN